MEGSKLLQEIKMHRFEEAYQGWGSGRLSQEVSGRWREAPEPAQPYG